MFAPSGLAGAAADFAGKFVGHCTKRLLQLEMIGSGLLNDFETASGRSAGLVMYTGQSQFGALR